MNKIDNTYHKSVLTKEVLEGLDIKPDGVYVDATFGGGGHSRAILRADPTCKVIAIDWDQVALETNAPRLEKEFGDRFKIVWGNFARLHFILKKEKIKKVDGVLADFGTSQHQILHKEGFSFAQDSPLDMRMSPAHQQITAEHVINNFSEKDIAQILFEYGEEPKSRLIAKKIVETRRLHPIKSTRQLAELVDEVARYKKPSKVHPATRVFQALRIFVNRELENIETFLKAAIAALAPNGRVACISFHSLEDRIVKTIFREKQDLLEIITRKPITASEEEITQNPSARSAKLRVAKKVTL
jgi:16S rRNA (cytosine1402-N4)-methyltransferase